MSYCEEMEIRIFSYFDSLGLEVRQKKMMGGMCFMMDDKMCCGTHIDKASDQSLLMVRVGEVVTAEYAEELHVLPMDFTGRPMKGYLFIEEMGVNSDEKLAGWLDKCIAFNPLAKTSKKPQRKCTRGSLIKSCKTRVSLKSSSAHRQTK